MELSITKPKSYYVFLKKVEVKWKFLAPGLKSFLYFKRKLSGLEKLKKLL